MKYIVCNNISNDGPRQRAADDKLPIGRQNNTQMNDLFYSLDVTPLMNDEALYDRAYGAVADADRRNKLDRIKVKRERCLSLGGTLLLQKALRERGIGKMTLAYGEQGKPFLAEFPGLHFNISHSGDYAVCALSDAAVGCDIEKIQPVREQVAARFFSSEENAALSALTDPTEREILFFRFWTLKESFLKAVGCGITEPLVSVVFDLSGSSPAISQRITSDAFFFREYRDIPGYCIALCRNANGVFPSIDKVTWMELM